MNSPRWWSGGAVSGCGAIMTCGGGVVVTIGKAVNISTCKLKTFSVNTFSLDPVLSFSGVDVIQL